MPTLLIRKNKDLAILGFVKEFHTHPLIQTQFLKCQPIAATPCKTRYYTAGIFVGANFEKMLYSL